MSLHVDSYGGGAPLLLIHGWGMHGGMWSGVAEQLAQHFRVHVVDLPGHGHGSKSEDLGARIRDSGYGIQGSSAYPALDSIVDELASQFVEPLHVCGWSLGGQLALRWAQRYPQQVSRLVMVASTPCFVRQADWPCAMAAETLAEFAAALGQNYAQTLRRFLALQVRGSEQERELLAALRGALFSRGEPDLAALQAGLEILRDCDLRTALPEIKQSTLVVAGERDTLTPPQAAQYLASQIPAARLAVIKGAAHAPFLSHPEKFMEHLMRFLHE